MNNRFSNNETFTPFTHGARGETFLSQFIPYPLRATSATRGTLADMRLVSKSIKREELISLLPPSKKQKHLLKKR